MPSRRPRSRSAQNGEPPTGVSTGFPPPIVTDRAGLRAASVNDAGARVGHLHHELAVPAHALAVDVLAEPRQQRQSALVAHVGADLLEDRHGVLVDGVERLAREHGRDAGVSEHRRRAYRIA